MLVDTAPEKNRRPRERRDARERRDVPVLVVTLLVVAALAATFNFLPRPSGGTDGFVAVDHDAAIDGSRDVVPGVASAAYAVFDADTGTFLAGRDLHGRRPVASIMKLLTAWVVMGDGDATRSVVVPAMDIEPDESVIGLREGEVQQRDVLLRAMLIVSANDAARALAIDVGGDEASFVRRMNDAARALGLRDTHATNPVGLDADGQYSSAHDVVRLGALLMEDPAFRETVQRREAKLHGDVHAATNDLLGSYDGADGIKTGHTRGAGWCSLVSATRDGRRVIVVVLGAPDEGARDADAATLLDWAFAQR